MFRVPLPFPTRPQAFHYLVFPFSYELFYAGDNSQKLNPNLHIHAPPTELNVIMPIMNTTR